MEEPQEDQFAQKRVAGARRVKAGGRLGGPGRLERKGEAGAEEGMELASQCQGWREGRQEERHTTKSALDFVESGVLMEIQ